MRELSAEARLHFYARSLSRRTGASVHHIGLYSAFAVIAADRVRHALGAPVLSRHRASLTPRA